MTDHFIPPAPSAHDLARAFDPLSLRVLHLAMRDAASGRPAKGMLAQAWRWFTGDAEAPRPLANPKLEMLRRFCISVMRGESESADLARTLAEKGHYDMAQLGAIQAFSAR